MKIVLTAGLASALLLSAARAASAQTGSIAAGVGFNFERANLVQGCNCFNLYGGMAQGQFGIAQRLALLADVTVTRQSGLTPDGYGLTQSTYMGGARFFVARGRRVRPFGDALLGLAHAGGSLAPSSTGYGSSNAFGFEVGGGLQLRVSKRWLLVPLEAKYLWTDFANGGSDRQNQLRLSAGLLYRFR